MSSLKRAIKSKQRLHKERHQPESRKHFGYLEKKKDYKTRAEDFQRKQNAFKLLRKKVLDKNPEEFHFHMFKSQLIDGIHYDKREDDQELSKDELKLIQTQDLNYVNHKRVIEMKKIDKLKQNLHLIDVQNKPKNRHTFFVDKKKDKKKFDFAEQMKTNKELLEMGFNFTNSDKLKNNVFTNLNERDIHNVALLRDKSYKELAKRIERDKFLNILSQKMDVKKKLLNKKESKPKKIKSGTATRPPVFKWKSERKR